MLSIMKQSCVTFRCVQSALQVKQQHTCADDVWLAVWITCLFGVNRSEREPDHYTPSRSKHKETSSCISTSHYVFVRSYLIISVVLIQYSFTTAEFKASVIFAVMLYIVGRGVFMVPSVSNLNERQVWQVIIIIWYVCLLSQAFLPGTSLEPAVIPTAHASSFTFEYFPYYVWCSKYSCLL